MDVSVKLTKMNIYLSAAIVQLLWDVYLMVQIPEAQVSGLSRISDICMNIYVRMK